MLFRGTACSSHGSDASRPPARIARGHGSPCSRCPPEPPLTRAGNPHSQPARKTITHDHRVWWTRPGSNRRPPGCKPGALPAELRAHDWTPKHARQSYTSVFKNRIDTAIGSVDLSSFIRMTLLRKEVIQPQVLLQLPCYDFTPITKFTIET